MKIVHVAPFYSPVIGGVKEAWHQIAKIRLNYTLWMRDRSALITYNNIVDFKQLSL